ncbi:MAG: hypothetical protein D6808_02105 [Candidatus Dadabacteria bacterium]|nr:MAG: hypothetical protein D6808_02105 [Candidatus Dadabacteria bacterium]
MQPGFVYLRSLVLLGALTAIMRKFVNLSLRRDVGIARERGGEYWKSERFSYLLDGWSGSDTEASKLEHSLSMLAPPLVPIYAVIYSLFAFDMIMAMDPVFFSNLFGGFVFIGNIYGAWAVVALWAFYVRREDPSMKEMIGRQQFHDLGKLTFGFAILWAYLFFSQFLPIWYGNMPEETQWLILRTRENPWRIVSWITFSLCFITPFVVLLSRDVKRVPWTLAFAACIVLLGLWLERYVLIMPEISPHAVPFGFLEIALFVGFGGLYALTVCSFMEKYPPVAIGDPAVYGD